jgi:chromate transporter
MNRLTLRNPPFTSATGTLTLPSLKDISTYFFVLGATSFGGTVVIAEKIREQLVEEKSWIDEEEYTQGFAFAQLAPGPLVPQLVMYLGYIRQGIAGATLAGLSFIAPSFLIVLLLSYIYVRSNGLPWIQAVFYGIGAAVVVIIAQAAYKLSRAAVKNSRISWFIVASVAVLSATTRQQVAWMFLAGGVISLVFKNLSKPGTLRSVFSSAVLPLVGLSPKKSLELLLFFTKAGLFVFGSGFAVVPLLHNGVVQEHHWLSESQFIDAVAVGMITPGPMVVIAAFIGFLVSGVLGAIAATIGVFLPIYIFVVIFAPHYKAVSSNMQVRAFLRGVTAAAAGAIVGTVYILGLKSIHDWPTVAIAAGTVGLLLLPRKIPEPLIIAAAGMAGFALYRFH